MTGPALAEAVRARYPRIKVVYTSGYTSDSINRAVVDHLVTFIAKPFTALDLNSKVREALDRESALPPSEISFMRDSPAWRASPPCEARPTSRCLRSSDREKPTTWPVSRGLDIPKRRRGAQRGEVFTASRRRRHRESGL